MFENILEPWQPSAIEQASNMEIVLEPLVEFTLFPKLPPELRQKIFIYALPNSRSRMLQVSGYIIAPSVSINTSIEKRCDRREPRLKPDGKCDIEFTLEENQDSASAKNLTLSCTCRESRAIFLQQNPHTLRTIVRKFRGLIRYAKQDIIYIANFDVLEYFVALLPYFDFNRFEVAKIPNLAIGVGRLLNCSVKGTSNQPVLAARKTRYTHTSFRLLTRLQGSKFLGLVCTNDKPYSQHTFRHLSSPISNEMLFVRAALNSTGVVRDILRTSKHWTDDNLPDVHILAINGERARG